MLTQFLGNEECPLSKEIPREVAVVEPLGRKWTMSFDGSAIAIALGMGIKHMKVLGDSNLIVSQIKGDFALREPSLASYRT